MRNWLISNLGSRLFIFEFREIKRKILNALFTKLCTLSEIWFGDLSRFDLVQRHVSSRKKKKKWIEAHQGSAVVAARLNFNTLYEVIGDLSSPRRRVNQAGNGRWLSSSFIVPVSLGRRSCVSRRVSKLLRVFSR